MTAVHLQSAAEVVRASKPAFNGRIGFSAEDSIPDWLQPIQAPQGVPNVVLILLDDVGFGATSTFGGLVDTPELDSLAVQGLRYNRFHVPALCSPTRAALLSGRNDHRAGFGQIMEATKGFPGYNGLWRKDTATVADVLRRNGYSTAAFGKWHNTPYSEITPVGPFDRWPIGLGFEYFYGFMGGADSHWEPSRLYRNTTAVEAYATPEQGYHLTTDITNDAINWVRTHQSLAPDKPYFLYFATGATHSPHHVPKEWIERYRGRFQQGWDKMREETFVRQKNVGVIPADAVLTPRPKELRAWSALSEYQQRVSAREMEVFAAFLSHTDHEIGRLLDTVQQGPQGDNTLILYIVGDNGAEGYGQMDEKWLERDPDKFGSKLARHSNMYTVEWAWATNTPFPWTKFVASHLGGTRDPLVISWPAHIKNAGGLRSQYTHVNDVAATLYEVTGVALPSLVDGVKQQALDGTSLAYTFDDPDAPSRHRLQIFEQAGNRSIYKEGWLAGARHMLPWTPLQHQDFRQDRWELYNLDRDFSQAHDLANEYPKKLKELQAAFDNEAKKNNVYPLLNMYPLNLRGSNQTKAGKREYTYYPGMPRIPASVAPQFGEHNHVITAYLDIPNGGAQGVILSFGGRMGGFVLYVKDGNLVYENQAVWGSVRDVIHADLPISRGKLVVGCEFVRTKSESNSGIIRLYINGRQVAEKLLAKVAPDSYMGTLGIGQAFGSPVSSKFLPPFQFTGTLERLTVRLQ